MAGLLTEATLRAEYIGGIYCRPLQLRLPVDMALAWGRAMLQLPFRIRNIIRAIM